MYTYAGFARSAPRLSPLARDVRVCVRALRDVLRAPAARGVYLTKNEKSGSSGRGRRATR